MPFEPDAAHLFFQLVSRRYKRGAMPVTSNRAVSEWGTVLGTTWWPWRSSIACFTTATSSPSGVTATGLQRAAAPTHTCMSRKSAWGQFFVSQKGPDVAGQACRTVRTGHQPALRGSRPRAAAKSIRYK